MLKLKIVIIKSLLFLLILNTSQALAISGKEIKELIKEHLLIQGITSNPLIRESRQFKDCNHKLNIENPYDSFRTVIVSCKTPLKWQVSIRTNAESKLQTKSKSKNSKDFKNIKLITLKHNLKKGELIQESDLKFDYRNNSVGNGYFIDKNKLIGREINQNLSRGQIIKVRHLKERFTVIEGQAIIIYANLNGINVKMDGNALQNGHLNELIKVRNNSSGKVVEGKIINEKRILINF
jgi:flagella basal body P-ring formation protein FlgA